MYLQLVNSVPVGFADYFSEATKKRIQYFGPINRINIFIGPNNSGKSRFLRNLLNVPKIFYSNNSDIYRIIIQIENLLKAVRADAKIKNVRINFVSMAQDPDNFDYPFKELIIQKTNGIQDIGMQYFENIDKQIKSLFQDYTKLNDFKLYLKQELALIQFLLNIDKGKLQNGNHKFFELFSIENLHDLVPYLKLMLAELIEFSDNLDLHIIKPTKRIYIPVYRSSILLTQADTDIYLDYIKSKYSFIAEDNLEIFTGQKLFKDLQTLQGSRREVKKRKKDFEYFLSSTFFNLEPTDITALDPTIENNQKHIAITIGSVERELHNLGDGVNTILILIYKLFTVEDNSWIFIEEPELFLHPSFQRIFINTLLNNEVLRKKNLKIFFTTQSNHLIDISMDFDADISIFTFNKTILDQLETFQIESVKRDDITILNLLGVNNSSVFISNCSIWVEGITDRKYINLFLRAYMTSNEFIQAKKVNFKEDLHFSFFEYAGKNIEHYLFGEDVDIKEGMNKIKAKFLSNRIFLLSDSDSGKEKLHEERAKKIGLNFVYEKTAGKEIENLLSTNNLETVLPSLVKCIDAEILVKMKVNELEYKNTGLGTYLSNKFEGLIDVNISADNGSLAPYYKYRLPDLLDKIIIWENMSNDAKELTIKIYDFIRIHNQNSSI